MNRIFKTLLFIFVLLSTNIPLSAKLKELIYPQSVDSIRIRMISPTGKACFGGLSYDRERFDIVYDYYHNKINSQTDTYEVLLNNWNEVSLFITILNAVKELPEEEVRIHPNDVKSTPEANWLKGLTLSNNETNDPIETRIKITLYMAGGDSIIAFMSSDYIDIQNYRYYCDTLFEWIECIVYKGLPTFGKSFITRKDLW